MLICRTFKQVTESKEAFFGVLYLPTTNPVKPNEILPGPAVAFT